MRIGQAPLSAYIEVDPAYESGNDRAQALASVIALLPRIRYLDVSFKSVSFSVLYSGAPGIEASMHSIREGLNGMAPSLEHVAMSGVLDLHENLFARQTPPGLRAVSLSDCTGLAPMSLFALSLTSLSMVSCKAWDTLDAMLSTLASMSLLKDFCWDTENYTEAELEQYMSPVMRPEHSVALPNLDILELEVQLECVAILMRYLDLPPKTSITVDGGFLGVPRVHGNGFENMLYTFDRRFTAHYSTAFREVMGGFDRLSVFDSMDHGDAGFSASADGYTFDKQPLSLQYGASSALDDTLEYLEILYHMLRWPLGLGENIVSPSLEVVELDGPAGRAFVAAVASTHVRPDDESGNMAIHCCRFMRRLVLRETKLGDRVVQRLKQYLDLRAKAGWPVVSLSIFQGTIACDAVKTLEDSAGATLVICDGEESWWDDHEREHWLAREDFDSDDDDFRSDGSEYSGETDSSYDGEDVDMGDVEEGI